MQPKLGRISFPAESSYYIEQANLKANHQVGTVRVLPTHLGFLGLKLFKFKHEIRTGAF